MVFQPLNSGNTLSTNYNQVNNMVRQLNNEQTTKVFKQASGNAIIDGKLPWGGYGQLLYDTTGKARILIGQHPVDKHMGIWISRDGYDVVTELGG